jgi:hypothetical protein
MKKFSEIKLFEISVIRKDKKTIILNPARSFSAPFVGFAFKIEVK